MALDKTKLVIEIETKSVGEKDRLKAIVKEIKTLEGATKKASKTQEESNNRVVRSLQKLNKTYAKLSKQALDLNQSLEILKKGYTGLDRTVLKTIRDFAALEKASVGVQKTTDLSGKSLNNFTQNIKGLSQEIPVSANELLGLAQAAGQLGVSGAANLENFAETVAKVGVSTDLTGDQAATAFTRILNVTNTSIDQIDEFASVIVRLGNNFAATESEIARMTNEVARSIGVFGASADQAAAIGTAMKSVGIRAELGGSAVGKLLRTLEETGRKGGAQMQQLSFITGMTGEQFRKTFKGLRSRPYSLLRGYE